MLTLILLQRVMTQVWSWWRSRQKADPCRFAAFSRCLRAENCNKARMLCTWNNRVIHVQGLGASAGLAVAASCSCW